MIPAIFVLALFAQAGPPSAQAPMKENRAPVAAEPAPGKEPQQGNVDRIFASVAIEGNNAELDMADLALKRGSANEVKGFAAKMIAEHKGLMDEISPVLQHVANSTPSERLSPADRLAMIHLQSVKPVDFDQLYVMAQVTGHLKMLSAFEAEAENGSDPRLKELVRKWMPTIQAHLQLAVDTAQHIGGASPFKGH